MSQTARKYDRYEESYNRYISGGAAIKPKPVRRTAPAPQRRVHKRVIETAEPAPAFAVDIVKGKRSVFLRALIFTAIFLGAFLSVFSMAYTEYRKFELNRLQNELGRLTRDNNALRSQISGSHNLTEVEAYAINVLGMVFPDESQIIYVDDILFGFTVRHEVYEEEILFGDVLREMLDTVRGIFRTEQ